jgi:hypothetical protein
MVDAREQHCYSLNDGPERTSVFLLICSMARKEGRKGGRDDEPSPFVHAFTLEICRSGQFFIYQRCYYLGASLSLSAPQDVQRMTRERLRDMKRECVCVCVLGVMQRVKVISRANETSVKKGRAQEQQWQTFGWDPSIDSHYWNWKDKKREERKEEEEWEEETR